MSFLAENEKEVRLKRYRSALRVCGKGMILLSCWSVIKGTMYMFMSSVSIRMLEEQMSSIHIGKTTYYVLVYALLFADLLLRVFVGRRAMREGNGLRQKNGYIVLAALMLMVSVFSLFAFFTGTSYYPDKADMVVSFLMELTSMANELEILRFSLGIRKLEKEGGR